MNVSNPKLEIRVHGVDGSQTAFAQEEPAVVQRIIRESQRLNFFAQERIIIAGQSSVTTFVVSKIARIDLTGEAIAAWKPKTASETPDIMEISEQEFLSQAQGRDGKHVERRKNQHAPGQHFVGFNDIQLVGGRHIYLRFQGVAVPPADRLQRIHSFLTLPGLAFRLPGGGLGIVNLTNAVKLTAYPGPAEVPTDAWVANEETDQAIIGRKGNE